MEKKRWKWQIFLGIVLLAGTVGCLFLPRMTISGDRYLSMVMEVNRMAERENMEVAKNAGTTDIVDTYERGTSRRAEKSYQYQQEIDAALQGRSHSITGAELALWCLTNDGTLHFRGIEYQTGEQIEWAHLEETFRVMGILLLLPSVMAIITILVMLLRRKTQRLLMFFTGAVSIGLNMAWLEIVPELVWERVSNYILSFDMIPAQILQINEVGEYSIRMILQQFAAQGYYLSFAAGGILVVAALLFWTIWRPYSKVERQEELFLDAASEADKVEQWEVFSANPLPEKQIQVRPPGEAPQRQPGEESASVFPIQMEVKGYLHGVQGQYAGFDFEIEPGQEIVFGRDEEFCDVTFTSPQISRRHCGIRYDEVTGCYQVIDYSVMGTMLSNGRKVTSGSYMVVHPGTIVYLGTQEEAVRLG